MKYKKIKAFTLIELLVVMGIIGVVMVLGVWGMISLQRTVELQQAINDVNAILKETRSRAENNVFPVTYTSSIISDSVYAYRIRFYQDPVDLTYHTGRDLCVYDASGPSWDCDEYIDESLNPENIFTVIEYLSSGTDQFCDSILFINLIGDIMISDTFGGYTADSCEVLIKHGQSGKWVILHVDGVINKYTIESL